MKKILFTSWLMFCISPLFSQYNVSGNGTSTDRARDIQRKNKIDNYSKSSTHKSRLNYFLNDDWQGGVMFTNESTSINGFSYRYNIYTDQIELRSLVDPTTVEIISIGSRKFIYSDYLNQDSILDEGYFELIVDGDCRLLLRRDIKYTQRNSDVEGYGSSESTSINEKLYIKKGDESAVEIVKSKEFLREYLSDKEKAVDYINKQLIVFYSEKKVKEIVEYYNKI